MSEFEKSLLERADLLEREADDAYLKEDYKDGERLDKQASALRAENEERRNKAQAQEQYFSEDEWDSGRVNAEDTIEEYKLPWTMDNCERWEMIAGSAEFVRDTK